MKRTKKNIVHLHHKSQTKKTPFLNNSLSTLTLHSPRLMSNSKGFTAFVVDDNPSALQTLANDLSSLPEFSSVHTFQSYTEATLPLIELQPDVLFLDVEVPGKSGLEFLDSIPEGKLLFPRGILHRLLRLYDQCHTPFGFRLSAEAL